MAARLLTVLLLSVLLGLARPGSAQVNPAGPVGNRVFTHADTLQALHQLLLSNRRQGRVMTALVPVLIGTTIYAGSHIELNIDVFGTGQPDTSSDLPLVGAMLAGITGVVLAVTGPSTWSRNNKVQERAAVAAFEHHQPLLPRQQRQLHRQLELLLRQPPPAAKP